MALRFEWDEEKNALNREKHGISFETAAEINRIGEIDAAFIFGVTPCGIHLPGSGLCKVEDDKGGKYLLKDQFGPLGMEVNHTHGML